MDIVFQELISDNEISAAFCLCGPRVYDVFKEEPINERAFVLMFQGAASSLYRVTADGVALGVIFAHVENRRAVKWGAIGYQARYPVWLIRKVFAEFRRKLAFRSVTCMIAEVAESNEAAAAICRRALRLKVCGSLPCYFGADGMIVFYCQP